MTFEAAGDYVDVVRETGTPVEIRSIVNWYRRVHGERAISVARHAAVCGDFDTADVYFARMKLSPLTDRDRIIEGHCELISERSWR